MSKSLAELRTSPRVGLPERSYSLCVASTLVAEVQSLMVELEDVRTVEAARRDGDESGARPRRMGESPASVKIRGRLSELQAEMVEHTGILVIRGWTEGDWRIWVDAHPAREGNERDEAFGYGFCNTDDLIDNLHKFAHTWNDEPITAGDWTFLSQNSAPGDLKSIASMVVQMHETVVNLPKLLTGSLATLDAGNA